MEAATFPHVSWDSTSATRSRRHKYRTLSIQRVSKGRPKLRWLDAGRERHVTRRDVVSSQTQGNSVRVAEDVLRVEGLSHKNRASSSVG